MDERQFKRSWTLIECAEFLAVSHKTICRMVKAGDIQAVEGRFGGRRIDGAQMNKLMGGNDKLLKPSAVAEKFGISRSTVYVWFHEGRLRGIKLTSGTVRIYQSSVDDFLSAAEELSQLAVGLPDEKLFVRRNSTSKEPEALPALARKSLSLRQTGGLQYEPDNQM